MRFLILINKIIGKAYRLIYCKIITGKKIKKLVNSEDENLKKMGLALLESLSCKLDDEEERIVDTVEGLRKELIDSDRTILAGKGTEEEDSVSYLAKVASKKENWAILLMKLISYFNLKKGLEFGTCIGISASYQASRMDLNGESKFVTMEGIRSRNELAIENFQKLGIRNVETHLGAFDTTLSKVLANNSQFDYLFIDGDHRYKATVENFNKVLPYLQNGSIVVVDDIKWSKGMRKAWAEIKKFPQVTHSFDLFLVGICIVSSTKSENTKEYKMALW